MEAAMSWTPKVAPGLDLPPWESCKPVGPRHSVLFAPRRLTFDTVVLPGKLRPQRPATESSFQITVPSRGAYPTASLVVDVQMLNVSSLWQEYPPYPMPWKLRRNPKENLVLSDPDLSKFP